jgi:hypothetical protein
VIPADQADEERLLSRIRAALCAITQRHAGHCALTLPMPPRHARKERSNDHDLSSAVRFRAGHDVRGGFRAVSPCEIPRLASASVAPPHLLFPFTARVPGLPMVDRGSGRPSGLASPPPKLCGPMSASVGFRLGARNRIYLAPDKRFNGPPRV